MSSEDSQNVDTARVDETLRRMRHRIGVKSDSQLADYIGVSSKTPSNWRARGSIPEEYTRLFAEQTNTSLDWLVLHVGEIGDYYALGGHATTLSVRDVMSVAAQGAMEDFVFVNRYAGRPSAGAGNHLGYVEPVHEMAFRREWLDRMWQSNPDHLACFKLGGDSMERTLFDGDLILFGLQSFSVDDIYLIDMGDDTFVKRLRQLPGDLIEVISDNDSRYKPFQLTADQREAEGFYVRGRFMWRGGSRL